MKIMVSPAQLAKQRKFNTLFLMAVTLVLIISIWLSISLEGNTLIFVLPIAVVIAAGVIRDLNRNRSLCYDEKMLYVGKGQRIREFPLHQVGSITIGRFDRELKISIDLRKDGWVYVYAKLPGFVFFSIDRKDLSKIRELRALIDQAKARRNPDFSGKTRIHRKAELG